MAEDSLEIRPHRVEREAPRVPAIGDELLENPDILNAIIDAAASLGCALYDPQTAKRYEQPEAKPV